MERDETFLTAKEVSRRYCLSIGGLNRAIREGTFPQPVRIFKNLRRWPLSALQEYERERMTQAAGGEAEDVASGA